MSAPDQAGTPDGVLAGLAVVDLCGDRLLMASRIFADLGATVVRVHVGGDQNASPRQLLRRTVWGLGTTSVHCAACSDDPRLLVSDADIVLHPGQVALPGVAGPSDAPAAVWVYVTPFGSDGPRASWTATDLGIMASSGNLYLSGYPDRAPVRCSEPLSEAHAGPEVVLAALLALPQRPVVVDVSMQEAVLAANMGLSDRARTTGEVLGRDGGVGGVGTTPVWACLDGYVVLGLAGGTARQATMTRLFELMAAAGHPSDDLASEPWTFERWMALGADGKAAVSDRIAAFFRSQSARELQEIALRENLMWAAVHTARDVLSSEQLRSRRFFARMPSGGFPVPGYIAQVREGPRQDAAQPVLGTPARSLATGPARRQLRRIGGKSWQAGPAPDWERLAIAEFTTSAAGPILGRYFAEQGSTVIRIESAGNPDFLRMHGRTADYGLDAAPMFDIVNAGKLSVCLDMSRPEGRAIARRIALRADLVVENFGPKTMPKLGLNYDNLQAERADLIMLSSCLNGQTGPHASYPGFGGQGSALSGYTFLASWPDRAPLGPVQAVTDSISPRFGALLLAALLYRRERTGRGAYVDLSQVEVAAWTLSPWLAAESALGPDLQHYGNRDPDGIRVPHGVFPAAGPDRWVALSAGSDADWRQLAGLMGGGLPARWDSLAVRIREIDAVEAAVAAWTRVRTAPQVAGILQAAGLEGVVAASGADCMSDIQLHHRRHYQALGHPTLGERLYERSGFRIGTGGTGYRRPSPLLGQHAEAVLGSLLGMPAADIEQLRADGVVR
jgi:crotonobetainyl-CoA:carnitine CoA-transferase CaiB-like acyl-CoA transferase